VPERTVCTVSNNQIAAVIQVTTAPPVTVFRSGKCKLKQTLYLAQARLQAQCFGAGDSAAYCSSSRWSACSSCCGNIRVVRYWPVHRGCGYSPSGAASWRLPSLGRRRSLVATNLMLMNTYRIHNMQDSFLPRLFSKLNTLSSLVVSILETVRRAR
jgi:hypothetical protein